MPPVQQGGVKILALPAITEEASRPAEIVSRLT
jgi:hypothetical protein